VKKRKIQQQEKRPKQSLFFVTIGLKYAIFASEIFSKKMKEKNHDERVEAAEDDSKAAASGRFFLSI
jgi:hypothetical protein